MWVTAAALLALGAGAALAQQRAPVARDRRLIELAAVLGESHALRQTCLGGADQYWRLRMQRLMDVESPDEELKRRLTVSFNAGYGDGQARFPACSAAARREALRLLQHGRILADALAAR